MALLLRTDCCGLWRALVHSASWHLYARVRMHGRYVPSRRSNCIARSSRSCSNQSGAPLYAAPNALQILQGRLVVQMRPRACAREPHHHQGPPESTMGTTSPSAHAPRRGGKGPSPVLADMCVACDMRDILGKSGPPVHAPCAGSAAAPRGVTVVRAPPNSQRSRAPRTRAWRLGLAANGMPPWRSRRCGSRFRGRPRSC